MQNSGIPLGVKWQSVSTYFQLKKCIEVAYDRIYKILFRVHLSSIQHDKNIETYSIITIISPEILN